MKIDYSVNPNSKYFLFMDVPYRQAFGHFGLFAGGREFGLSMTERVKHLGLAVLKTIFGVGHIASFIDTALNRKSISRLILTSTDPFLRGKEHGHILKDQIREVYTPILAKYRKNSLVQERFVEFEKQIPEVLKEEMRGIAEGSGFSYKDVLLIHSFLDALPGQFGCTSMAVKETAEKCERIVSANHSLSSPDRSRIGDDFREKDSLARRSAFLDFPISKNEAVYKVLHATGKQETIQSIVFDTTNREITLASSGSYATEREFITLPARSLFNSHDVDRIDETKSRIRLFRNLDWSWYFLGQETVVLTRPHANGNSTVSITWPGYIGTLSGMNSKGLAIAENQNGIERNPNGIPNPLLLTYILDTCSNLSDADRMIQNNQHGSEANIVIADTTSAKSYEFKVSPDLVEKNQQGEEESSEWYMLLPVPKLILEIKANAVCVGEIQ